MKPLCIDLFCGLGGWAEGFLAEGWDVIGFDIERHRYPKVIRTETAQKLPGNNGGVGSKIWSERPIARLKDANDGLQLTTELDEYPAQLVLQDVLTLHGSQFRNADCIVASPPCQAYSYRAMPWKRAKALPPPSNELFDACFRIQREACVGAWKYIPLIVENVCGAQRWVGRAKWHYGSYYLWGDVPALMPVTLPAFKGNPDGTNYGQGSWFAIADSKNRGAQKVLGFRFDHNWSFQSASVNKQPVWFNDDKRKCGGDWFGSGEDCSLMRQMSSRSSARKAASAQIAKIPFELSSYIARVFKPDEARRIA